MTSPTENEIDKKVQVRCSKIDFSIDHILNTAGNSKNHDKVSRISENTEETIRFPWLHCTRYCPPKIPRNQRKDAPQKRQLGRHPRIPFTSQQLAVLEEKFHQTPYLSSAEVTKISRSLQLADVRVKIWFQNRRARERRDKTQYETEQNISNHSNCTASTSTSLPSTTIIKLEDSKTDYNVTSSLMQISIPSTATCLEACSNIRHNASFLYEFHTSLSEDSCN